MDQPSIGGRIAAVFRPAPATTSQDVPPPVGFKTPSRLMAATITIVLLLLFGISYLAPALKVSWLKEGAEFDAALQQTLLTLLVLAVGYYIGSSKGSAEANDAIRAQVPTAPPPVLPVVLPDAAQPLGSGAGGPTGKPGDPVSVTEEKKP